MSAFAPGAVIDERYVVIELIGEGGMGSVVKAREIGLERVVAIKILHELSIGDVEARARFQREAHVLSNLKHPGIVSFYRFGSWQSHFYIAMEYLEGRTLRNIISTEGLSTSESILIALQICDAVQSAHCQNVFHRDLKPDNVIVTIEEEMFKVKLVDFGLARAAAFSDQKLTETGLLIGSAPYMSPEQCTRGKADHRSDIYSLGCILFEMLSGVPPYTAENPIALIFKHANEPLPKLVPINRSTSLPTGIESVVDKALEKLPERRYQSMQELAADLVAVQQGVLAPIKIQGPRPPAVNTVPFTILLTGLLLIVLCSFGIGLFRTPPVTKNSLAIEATSAVRVDRHSRRSPEGIIREASELAVQATASVSQRKQRLEEAEQLLNSVIEQWKDKAPPDAELSQVYALRANINTDRLEWSPNKLEDLPQIEKDCLASIAYSTNRDGKTYRSGVMGYRQLANAEVAAGRKKDAEKHYRQAVRIYRDQKLIPPPSFQLLAGATMPGFNPRDDLWCAGQAEILAAQRGDRSAPPRLKSLIQKWYGETGEFSVDLMLTAAGLAEAYLHNGMMKERRELLDRVDKNVTEHPSQVPRITADCYQILAEMSLADGRLAIAQRQLVMAVKTYENAFRTLKSSRSLLKTLKRLQFRYGPENKKEVAELANLIKKVEARQTDTPGE